MFVLVKNMGIVVQLWYISGGGCHRVVVGVEMKMKILKLLSFGNVYLPDIEQTRARNFIPRTFHSL